MGSYPIFLNIMICSSLAYSRKKRWLVPLSSLLKVNINWNVVSWDDEISVRHPIYPLLR